MEVVLGVGLNAAVAGGIADAEQGKSLADLIVVQEALVGLVNRTTQDLAGTGGAGSSSAGVGQIHTGFFGGVEDVHVIGALKGGTTFDADLVGGHSEKTDCPFVSRGGHNVPCQSRQRLGPNSDVV